MAHKHSKSKHSKKKHKKEKSKHKKEKKSKREKSKKHSTSSSSSSSSETEEETVASTSKHSEWNFLESALSHTNAHSREEKTVQPKPDRNVYEPRSNPRELNPYWKDNGTGLPPAVSTIKSRNMFLKPGDETSAATTFVRTHTSNWRKKDYNKPEAKSFPEKKTSQEQMGKNEEETTAKLMTNDEMNSIAAKLVKAEILGNKALVEKLKSQLEAAKKAKEDAAVSHQSQAKFKEVVILADNNAHSLKQKYQQQKESSSRSKRQKLNAQNEFIQENSKYSLQNMFLKEKTEVEEDILRLGVKANNIDEFDDVYLDAASSEKVIQKMEKRKEAKEVHEAIKKHKSLEGCSWCIDNRNDRKHMIVSTGAKCYLCVPEVKSLTDYHCIIVPIQHELSTRKLDEDVWEEIKTYQKLLTKMFSEKGLDVVFFESARSFRHFPHCYIQCVPLDKESGDLAPIYFQKAISESETEWSNNKKVIDFRNKDLTRSIPKDLPYFAVSFGTEGGFAHLIEDEQLFPRNFAEEVIGGMLDLDPARWRKPSKENFNAQREKALGFLKIWKKYEFNKSSDSDSESSSSE